MKFWPHGVYWRSRLRWYERASLVVWWLSLLFGAVCIAAAAAVVYTSHFTRHSIEGAVAVTLAGLAVVMIARFLLVLAVRKSRRRRVDVY